MRIIFFVLFYCCIINTTYSQSVTFKWADQIGSSKNDAGQSITTDLLGNVLTTGTFQGTADFDPGPGIYNLTPVGVNDVFITKNDINGNLTWAKQLGGLGHQQSYAIVTDAIGNVYITGYFSGTVDFDPGPAIYNLSAKDNGSGIFILKLDPGSNFIWCKEVGNNFYSNSAYAIALDPAGNVYTAGIFQGTADFDPGAAVFNLISTASSEETFFLKLDSNGNFIWAKQFYGTNGDVCYGIAVDANQNLYATGLFYGICDFDPGPNTYALTANKQVAGNWSDAYVCKLDVDGNFIWAKQMGGPLGDLAMSIAMDKAGNLLTTGKFQGTGDYDPGAGVDNLTTGNYYGTFISKLDNNGKYVWAKQFDNISGGCEGFAIFSDLSGDVYTTGIFYGTTDFDPGSGVFNQRSNPDGDIFLSKLDVNGSFVFAKQMNGTSFANGISMTVDALKNIYVTGYFFGKVDFDPGVAVYDLTDKGIGDIFVLKLSQCTNSSASFLKVNTCSSYTLNNQVYGASGIYSQTLPNGAGCDSTITLNLVIGGSLGTSYDTACNSEVWQGETLTASGNYAVKFVSANGCDSIINLHLLIKNKAVSAITETICQGQNYAGYTKSGVYTDTYTAANGCDSIRTLDLTVKAVSLSNTIKNICEGSSFWGYTQSGSYADTLVSANGCDSIRILNLQVNPKKYTVHKVSICEGSSYFAAGTYQTIAGIYQDTLFTIAGCDSIITAYLSVYPKPVIDIGMDRNLCFGETLTLSPGLFTSYRWQDQSTNSALLVNRYGTYWVKVTDGNNCSASDTISIKNILPVPTDFLNQTDSICKYEKLQVLAISNYSSYLWSTGSIQPSISVESPGKYILKVKDVNGCKGSDTINIVQKICYTGVYIPSAFTPNGDQLNDVFRARVYGSLISFSLYVYNNFGELVFSTNNPQKAWNGNFKGSASDVGVFVWTCFYQLQGGKAISKKGTITLIR